MFVSFKLFQLYGMTFIWLIFFRKLVVVRYKDLILSMSCVWFGNWCFSNYFISHHLHSLIDCLFFLQCLIHYSISVKTNNYSDQFGSITEVIFTLCCTICVTKVTVSAHLKRKYVSLYLIWVKWHMVRLSLEILDSDILA